VDAEIFYDYDDDKRMIFLKPEAHRFLRQNYGILTRVLLAEWVRYLERVNHGLPLLAAKLNDTYAERRPLTKYRREFLKYSDSCFYCMRCLEPNHIHVDHVIPWSYLFADEPWNLVLACRNCNLEKSDSLPREGFVDALIERDHRYSGMMKILEKSLIRLSYKGSWEDEIHSHYKICHEYGFEYWRAR